MENLSLSPTFYINYNNPREDVANMSDKETHTPGFPVEGVRFKACSVTPNNGVELSIWCPLPCLRKDVVAFKGTLCRERQK